MMPVSVKYFHLQIDGECCGARAGRSRSELAGAGDQNWLELVTRIGRSWSELAGAGDQNCPEPPFVKPPLCQRRYFYCKHY